VCRYHTPSRGEYSVRALLRSADGTLWIGTEGQGLLNIGARGVGHFTTAQGLIDDTVWALLEDRDRTLWAGTPRGVMRLERDGFIGYDANDGLVDPHVVSLVTDRQGGGVCALGTLGLLQCVRDGRLKALRLRGSPELSAVGWNQLLAEDRRGSWWLRAPDGLHEFAAGDPLVALGRPLRLFSKAAGHLPAERASRVFVDSRGDVWLGVWHEGFDTLVRRDARTGRFEWIRVPEVFGPRRVPGAFGEDRTGAVWVGFFDGGVARYRDGRLQVVDAPRESPLVRHVRAFLCDRKGRLWFAAGQDGLGRIDDPAAEHPVVARLGPKDGLASGDVRCVAEDGWGRLYVGTQRGVDRLDLATGSIRHYTSDDGLARGGVEVCTAANGRLWFGTVSGLSSLAPGVEPWSRPPPVFIERLNVAGAPQALSPMGETAVGPFELPYPGHVEVDYASPGRGIRYQYRLEGAESDWSAPSEARAVNFASLASGSYRFQVRALSPDGLASLAPASVSFRVVPPWWRRPWLLALLAAALGLVAYAGFRSRLARQLAVERVRTRIATDLHDDVGTTVSRMAILSEVVRRQVEGSHAEAARLLDQISASAREVVDATSDIVWSVNPRRDDVASLVTRVRELGAGLFEARGIGWEFSASPEVEAVRLDPEQRRQLLLVFKEALHNAARHAGAARVRVGMAVAAGRLLAEVEDDGKGIAGDRGQGHGLDSMRARAARLGGELAVDSTPGRGTRLRVSIPLLRHA
jgi:signal transduction histidine kinase